MAVSDGAIFTLLGIIVSLFLYYEFGRFAKIFSSIMMVVSGVGILRIDPVYGFASYIVMGAGTIMFIGALFYKPKINKRFK